MNMRCYRHHMNSIRLSNHIVDEMFDEPQAYGNIEVLDVVAVFALLAYEHYDGDSGIAAT